MTRRMIIAATAAAAAAALTACSSTTSGTPAAQSGSGTTTPSTATTSPGIAAATTPAGLAALLRSGLSSTRSAHITLRIATGGQTITGAGNETLAAGKLRGLDLAETIPSVGTLRIIQLDGKTYVQLPANLRRSSKPYSLVTTSSTDPTIKNLAESLQSSTSTSVGTAGVFAQAAQSITDQGAVTVAGVAARHYHVVVDVAKLPAAYSGRSSLTQAGISTLPIDLYVDSAGRPVRVTEQLTVATTSVATDLDVTRYNQPVTITAPPASQVSTG